MSPNSAARFEQVQTIVRGSGVLICMVVLCVVIVGYESEWLNLLKGQEEAQTLVPKLNRFVGALQSDSSLSLTRPRRPYADLSAAIDETTAAWISLGSALRRFGMNVGVAEANLAAYRFNASRAAAATDFSPATAWMLLSHQSLIAECVRMTYAVQTSRATDRLRDTLGHLAGQALSWRFSSLAARVALMHGMRDGASAPSATDTIELLHARAAFNLAAGFADEKYQQAAPSFTLLKEANSIVANSLRPRTVLANSTVTSIVATTSRTGLTSLSAFLEAQADTSFDSGADRSQTKVIVFAFGIALSFIMCVASIVIYLRHLSRTKRAVALVEAFSNPERSREMIQTYKPILQHLQTNVTLPPTETEVEREYLFAARIIQQLRPLMPQALFGDLNATHRKEANGAWDITSQQARTETGLAFCHVHVLTITFSTENMVRATKNHVERVLVESSHVLCIVTDEVNNSGGIVCGVAPDGRITCMWNATNVVESGAFVAVRTARAIDKRLSALGISHDLNIATGPSIIANNKVGQHKHVTYIGSAFEVGEKLLLLNESHSSRLVIDSDTFKELPRDFQRTCKPIAVLRDKDEQAVVAVAADAECSIKGDQWKHYNTAFTLYQNNMNAEALNEFKKYLIMYPDDDAAVWLVQNVLEKTSAKRNSVVLSKRPSSASRSTMAKR